MYNSTALVALGANLGAEGLAPVQMIVRALAALSAAGLPVRAVSRFFRTPAFPAGSGPDFVNACAAVDPGGRDPEAVLAVLHGIEADLGRVRLTRWGARVIDLDLLAMGDAILPDPATEAEWRNLPPETQAQVAPDRLILPHPRLSERGFVLIPLADIAPLWRHPATGQSVAAMAKALPEAEKAQIWPLSQRAGAD
jgi:2-amino-4-hydroxy-6-hydroxymethyldihydropteridine diphosphokinase